MPYEAERALPFYFYIKKHYNIPDENVINVGDELDIFHGSLHPKGADYPHTPKEEIKIAREKIKEWASVFPQMKLCVSNHGLRWVRKAAACELPEQVLRSYKDIFEMPEGWTWEEEWYIPTKHPFRVIHGMEYSGQNGHRFAAIDSGVSTAIGHLHSHAGIVHLRTAGGKKIWGFNTGCTIDIAAYAFKYGKYSRMKPCLGGGIVFNRGTTPVWVPYE